MLGELIDHNYFIPSSSVKMEQELLMLVNRLIWLAAVTTQLHLHIQKLFGQFVLMEKKGDGILAPKNCVKYIQKDMLD